MPSFPDMGLQSGQSIGVRQGSRASCWRWRAFPTAQQADRDRAVFMQSDSLLPILQYPPPQA